MTSGLARFGRPQTLVCNLGTSGTLPNHTPGTAYSGTFNVTNRVGTVTAELVSATPALPAGWSLQVNQATGVVTLAWPAGTPAGALPNLNFESDTADWVLGNGWTIDSTGLVESGTQSAKYRGVGQAAMLHAQLVPVTPGQSITATARISTGITREDFAGAEPGLLWHDANGVPISFSAAINDPRPRGPAFQTVIAQGVAPPGAAFVRLFVSGFRDLKGRARDSVYVDTVTWTHTYSLGGGQATNYAVVIRVRDGRGCQATLSQTINAVTGNAWDTVWAGGGGVLQNSSTRIVPTINGSARANRLSVRPLAGNCYFSGAVFHSVNTGGVNALGVGTRAAVGVPPISQTAFPGSSVGGGQSIGVYGPDGIVFWAGLNRGSTGGVAAGQTLTLEFAVRVSSRRVWVRPSGGAWFGGGNPATDTSPSYTIPGTGDIYVWGSPVGIDLDLGRISWVDLHPTAAETTGVVPSGFTAANWA